MSHPKTNTTPVSPFTMVRTKSNEELNKLHSLMQPEDGMKILTCAGSGEQSLALSEAQITPVDIVPDQINFTTDFYQGLRNGKDLWDAHRDTRKKFPRTCAGGPITPHNVQFLNHNGYQIENIQNPQVESLLGRDYNGYDGIYLSNVIDKVPEFFEEFMRETKGRRVVLTTEDNRIKYFLNQMAQNNVSLMGNKIDLERTLLANEQKLPNPDRMGWGYYRFN